MSTKGNLSREQAVAIVGEAAVLAAERDNAEHTNRLMPDNDSRVEFVGAAKATDRDGIPCAVRAYYYQEGEALAECDDLGSLSWTIEGYEVA
jgi:hypothetical protein